MTHADCIRAMTDEELAEWFIDDLKWIIDDLIEPGYYTHEQGYKLWLDWLKEECDNEAIST